MKCTRKHTNYQPTTVEDFACPTPGCCGFLEDYNSEEECGLLHYDDLLYCPRCGLEVKGIKLVHHITKDKTLVFCRHCNGSGRVLEDKK